MDKITFVKRDDFVDVDYHPYPTYTTNELADKPESYFITVDDGGRMAEINGWEVEYYWKFTDDKRRIALVYLWDVDIMFFCDVPISEQFKGAQEDHPWLFLDMDTLEYLPEIVRVFRLAIGL